MRTNKKRVPKLRFEGVHEEWDEKKIGEISSVEMCKRIFKHQTTETGEIPFYKIGTFGSKPDSYISKKIYIEYVNKYPYPEKNDVLISASGTIGRTIVYDGEFAYYQDSNIVWLRTDKTRICNTFLLYLYGVIKWDNVEGSTIKRLYNSNILNTVIFLPSMKEQTLIGNFFKKLDEVIHLLEEELSKYKELKKAYLAKMFPKEGEKVPELRFPIFSGEWEEKELGGVAQICTGKLDANAMVENGKYDFYTSGIQKYSIDVPAFCGPAITIAGNGATVGYMHLADGKFNAYQRTYVLNDFSVDRQFLFYSIKMKLPKKIQGEARTGNIPYIVMDMLTDLLLDIPETLDECVLIGNFFKELDETIELKAQELEKYKDLKKAYLAKMFV